MLDQTFLANFQILALQVYDLNIILHNVYTHLTDNCLTVLGLFDAYSVSHLIMSIVFYCIRRIFLTSLTCKIKEHEYSFV